MHSVVFDESQFYYWFIRDNVMNSTKIVTASQARIINMYKNSKHMELKRNASMYCNAYLYLLIKLMSSTKISTTHARKHLLMSSVASPALPYFSTLSHKGHESRKTLLDVKYVFWYYLQHSSLTFLILITGLIQRGIIINVCPYACNVPVIPLGF